jgi:hypothetical protein
MAALGAVLLALGTVGLGWPGTGPRLLLAGLGLFAAVRGAAMLRRARSGEADRSTAISAAGAVWLGLVLVALALLSATATGWALVAIVVLACPVLATALPGSRPVLVAVGAAVLVAGVAVAVLGGVDVLLDTGRTVAALLVGLLGVANLAGAVGMARIARRPEPEPAPAAGCGGCACGAGGCGSLR